jgi:hypothetical protein
VVFGFPLFTSVAMRHVEAVHASVIVGVLPLATAWSARCCTGSARRRLLDLRRAGQRAGGGLRPAAFNGGGGFLHQADLLLLAAMGCAAVGYGYGAKLSQRMRAEHVICWALVIALPLTLPLAWPVAAAGSDPASGLVGLRLRRRVLDVARLLRLVPRPGLGGTVRVSQVQLVQPFLSMLFAVPLLGERLDATTSASPWP